MLSGFLELALFKRCRAGNQLVEQDAQRVDVAARIDGAQAGLLGAHVQRGANNRLKTRVDRAVG